MFFFLSFVVDTASAASGEVVVPPAETFQMKGDGFDVTLKAHGDVLIEFEIKPPNADDPVAFTLSTYDFVASFPDMGMSVVCENLATEITPMRKGDPTDTPNVKASTTVFPMLMEPEGLEKFLELVTDSGKKKQVEKVLKASTCKTEKMEYMGLNWFFMWTYLETVDGRKTYELVVGSPEDSFFIVNEDVPGSPYMCGSAMGKTKNIVGPCVDENGVPIQYGSGLPWAVIIGVAAGVVLVIVGVAVYISWMKKKSLSNQVRLPVASQSKKPRPTPSRRH